MHLKKGQQQLLYSTFDFPEVAMLQEEQALTTSSYWSSCRFSMSMLPSTIILCNIAGSPEICNCIGIIYILCTFITWLQQDARSDWLFSGQYFLVITGLSLGQCIKTSVSVTERTITLHNIINCIFITYSWLPKTWTLANSKQNWFAVILHWIFNFPLTCCRHLLLVEADNVWHKSDVKQLYFSWKLKQMLYLGNIFVISCSDLWPWSTV